MPPVVQEGIKSATGILEGGAWTHEQALSTAVQCATTAQQYMQDPVMVSRVTKALAQIHKDPSTGSLLKRDYTGLDRDVLKKRVGKARILYDVVENTPQVVNIDFVKNLFTKGSPGKQRHQ